MKRFVKCFFELLTQIIVKVRKCKVQRVCVLHFQLAGSGGFFLMKLSYDATFMKELPDINKGNAANTGYWTDRKSVV